MVESVYIVETAEGTFHVLGQAPGPEERAALEEGTFAAILQVDPAGEVTLLDEDPDSPKEWLEIPEWGEED